MKAKLIKTEKGYHLDTGKFDGIHLACYPHDVTKQRLSFKNCQAIERGYDLDELAREMTDKEHPLTTQYSRGYEKGIEAGFQKALELMGDKKFSEQDMRKAYKEGYYDEHSIKVVIQSLQQTEWDVEVEMVAYRDGDFINDGKTHIIEVKFRPALDADGCLILKRI